MSTICSQGKGLNFFNETEDLQGVNDIAAEVVMESKLK